MTLTWRKIIACAHIWLGHRLGHGHSRWRESTRVGMMMQVRPLAGPSARAHVHAACKAWLLAFVCMFLHEHLQRVSAQYFSCPQHAACVHNNLVLEHSNIAVRATDRVDDD